MRNELDARMEGGDALLSASRIGRRVERASCECRTNTTWFALLRIRESSEEQISQALVNKFPLMGCHPPSLGTALALVMRWKRPDCMEISLTVNGEPRESKPDERLI